MDSLTIQILRDLNNLFYKKNASSFSETRQSAWTGWEHVAEEIESIMHRGTVIDLIDMGCGNLRFEKYLLSRDEDAFRYAYAVDSCPELVEDTPRTEFKQCDIVEALVENKSLKCLLEVPECAVTVAFGLIHHIPSFELRQRFIANLSDLTQPGGLIAVSFWQFMDDPAFAEKVRNSHAAAQGIFSLELEENDYLLGWQGDFERTRYCHHFNEGEIDSLISPLNDCSVVASYSADGRNGRMNRYVMLQKHVSL